ncbi:MAG TPA: peptide chain release factor N(5)-glutamine methyltransferase [Rhodopila sp.]|uniref:peptide chain release factor N(5)-glutamine methyltransferase n=1 Tax=Rhodopila sp. TaxID=2480087 RepID=UPI002BA0690C|nr:peptide chain release factor N(5)-glutamine methyltransferase [Rhodopila sp.]HVY15447.1 peptide chain release factor N(5)-glutamine methyltransferase [Rhodopila sp.]
MAALLRAGAQRLAGIADDPRREARLLLAHALGVPATELIRDPNRPVPPDPFRALLARRAAREPMALILGHQGFWTLDLCVSPATLIPRADSETVVGAVLKERQAPPARILDLGTGTGCLLLALLSEYPDAIGIGIDRSPAAAALARRNAGLNGLSDRSYFVAGDWTDPLDGRFDVVVSNPPYIPAGDIAGLMPEVAQHEPRSALDGGPDGCDAYRTILPRLGAILAPDGLAVLELGAGQAATVAALAAGLGLDTRVHQDLAGIDRALVLRTGIC